MKAENTEKIIGKVELRLINPLRIEWKCSGCGKRNVEIYFSAPGRITVQCDYCGRVFIGEG